jgi:hypothetical protein
MKLTAHQLALIIDTLNHSLMVSNWNGCYNTKSREKVRDDIAAIMDEMSVEILIGNANFTDDADAGI